MRAVGGQEMGEGGQNVQAAVITRVSSGNLMYGTVTVLSNTALYIWKLLRVNLESSRHT